MLSRRGFIAASAYALCGWRGDALASGTEGLRSLRRRSKALIGGQTTIAEIKSDAALAGRIAREFELVTPGRELKWETLQPSPGDYRFEYADAIVEWAEKNRMRVRGHNLIWPNYGTPDWVKQSANRGNARSLLENHVRTVVQRYAGRIYAWDVLNEPLNVWDKRVDSLAAKPWADLLGQEYMDAAFHVAASTDPHARLIWNQNYLESTDAGDEENRQAMLAHLRRMKRNGTPIHGIGIESHLFAEKPLAKQRLERFLGEVRGLGLEVHLTEVDVIDTQLPADVAKRDTLVAGVYRDYLDFMLRVAEPSVISFWSFSDRRNWLDWIAPTVGKYMRADHLPHRPGLVDANLNNKPAYWAVQQILSAN